MFMPEVVNELLAAIAEGQSLERWCDAVPGQPTRPACYHDRPETLCWPPVWDVDLVPAAAVRAPEVGEKAPNAPSPKERSPSISCASAKTSR
jgi:hypothetical protein